MTVLVERVPHDTPSQYRQPKRPRRHRRPVLFVCAALVAFGGLAAWLWEGATPGRTVYVVGDSISALSSSAIVADFTGAGYQATVTAVPGVKLGQAQANITTLAQHQPWAWIIELGTNDSGARNPDWRAPFFAEWDAVSPATCVIYVTVNQRAGEIARQVDSAIETLAQTHVNVHVLDWGTLEFQNPAWVAPDGVHPTAAGQTTLARLEMQALQQDC